MKQIAAKSREYHKEVYAGINKRFWEEYVKPTMYMKYNYQCQDCGSTRYPEIHHLNYSDRLTLNDLKLLCKSCHRKLHWAERKKKNTVYGDIKI